MDCIQAQEITDTQKREVDDLKFQLKRMIEEHRNAIEEVLKLAKIIHFDVDNLECTKIDIGEEKTTDDRNCPGTLGEDEEFVRNTYCLRICFFLY